MHNDLLLALDNQCVVLMIALDLSAAFDTVDHEILLKRLHTYLGISGVALQWLRSYLTHRQQMVTIQGSYSPSQELRYGVPQGSVLGPVLFNIYTLPLGQIISRHSLTYHIYADDSELYLVLKPSDEALNNGIKNIEHCLSDVRHWMHQNKLKLNDGKTEFTAFGSKQQLAKVTIPSISIGDANIPPSSSGIKSLGVTQDPSLTLEQHVNQICRSANIHIRTIGQLRRFLTKTATISLTHAFVTSRLDANNALLYGVQTRLLRRMQKVLNTAARIVTNTSRKEHITPVLKSLHWLDIKSRVQYKILLITYKALSACAPQYISNLLHVHATSRCLRSSSDTTLLTVPKTNRPTFGDRAYSKAAPTLWNSLPASIRTAKTIHAFKAQLKAHLFAKLYL